MFYLYLLIFLLVSLPLWITIKNIYVKTSTMAAVMSLGIITQGVLLNYFGPSFLQGHFGKTLGIINLSLWFSFTYSFFMSYFGGKFKEIHYLNKVNRFGMGTWVAGTSISAILFYKQFIKWRFVPELMMYLDISLWILYIGISVKTFFEIIQTKSYRQVHGILLLTTVGTQSIVLLVHTVINEPPAILETILLATGFFFYLASALFILYRYMGSTWSIENDWNNTNCILHGALSITGLACAKTSLVDGEILSFIWMSAFMMFIAVEAIEIIRLVKRIKSYGLIKGFFIYDVTQWSRIFTFAMFYTFTSAIKKEISLFPQVTESILTAGMWLIIGLLTIEILLSVNHVMKTYKTTNNESENTLTSLYQ